jgi:hypothetical protein
MMKKSILILLGGVLGSQVMGTQSQGTPGQRNVRLEQQKDQQRQDQSNNVQNPIDRQDELGPWELLPKNDCPVLNLTTLPKAACATKEKPYTHLGSPNMRYHAITECPSGLGARKFFQKLLGNREYHSTLTGELQPAEIKCTYTLPPYLDKPESSLSITAPITSMKQVSGLLINACPELGIPEFEQLWEKKEVTYGDYHFTDLDGTIKKVLDSLQEDSTLGPSGYIEKFPRVPLQQEEGTESETTRPALAGTLEITALKHRCQYTYHTWNKEETLILEGEDVSEDVSEEE